MNDLQDGDSESVEDDAEPSSMDSTVAWHVLDHRRRANTAPARLEASGDNIADGRLGA